MTKLQKFFKKHGVTAEAIQGTASKTAVGAAFALVAIMTILPKNAMSQEFNADTDTPAGQVGYAKNLMALGERTTDLLHDLMKIEQALNSKDSDFYDYVHKRSGGVKLEKLIAVYNDLYYNTPHENLAGFDNSLLPAPENTGGGSNLEYAIDTLNKQREILNTASQQFRELVAAYETGDRYSAKQAKAEFTTTMQEYQTMMPNIESQLFETIANLSVDSGYEPRG